MVFGRAGRIWTGMRLHWFVGYIVRGGPSERMNKRPLSITIIGWFFIGLGTFVILANVFWLVHGQGLVHGNTKGRSGRGRSGLYIGTQ